MRSWEGGQPTGSRGCDPGSDVPALPALRVLPPDWAVPTLRAFIHQISDRLIGDAGVQRQTDLAGLAGGVAPGAAGWQ